MIGNENLPNPNIIYILDTTPNECEFCKIKGIHIGTKINEFPEGISTNVLA